LIFHHPGPGSPAGVAAVYEVGIGMLIMSQQPLNRGLLPVFVVIEVTVAVPGEWPGQLDEPEPWANVVAVHVKGAAT
jgi:hypothetical protein